jgi:hypothetical protein
MTNLNIRPFFHLYHKKIIGSRVITTHTLDSEETPVVQMTETVEFNGKIQYAEVISKKSLEKGLEYIKSGKVMGLDKWLKLSFSIKQIEKLRMSLKSQKYEPLPAHLSSPKDMVLEAAILIHLEPIFEKLFLDCSVGFRPKRNCHMALHRIKHKWQNVAWIIQIDVFKHLGTSHNEILFDALRSYCDQATVELIAKLLMVRYTNMFDLKNFIEHAAIGHLPRGSLIFPVLVNFYFHVLDVYITASLLTK